jgi:hypothetical protein
MLGNQKRPYGILLMLLALFLSGCEYFGYTNWDTDGNHEMVFAALKSDDGGYLMVGETNNRCGVNGDVFLAKTDAQGTELWANPLGAAGNQRVYDVALTGDGAALVAGSTSFTDASGEERSYAYIAKIDAFGEVLWSKSDGGTAKESVVAITECAEGEIAFVMSRSPSSSGEAMLLLVKLSSQGEVLWEQPFEEQAYQRDIQILEWPDGDLAVIASRLNADYTKISVFMRFDSEGNPGWQASAPEHVAFHNFTLCGDGGAAFIGTLYPSNDYQIQHSYLYKLDKDGTLLWSRLLYHVYFSGGMAITETSVGGFFVAGDRYRSASAACTDADGQMLWSKEFGDSRYDYEIADILEEEDGNMVLSGSIATWNTGDGGAFNWPAQPDAYLLKLDPSGEEMWHLRTGEPEDNTDCAWWQKYFIRE